MRWGGHSHISDEWQEYLEAAHHHTGCPRLVCIRCGEDIAHPTPTNSGTNSLRNHRSTKNCESLSTNTYSNMNIQSAFEKISFYVSNVCF